VIPRPPDKLSTKQTPLSFRLLFRVFATFYIFPKTNLDISQHLIKVTEFSIFSEIISKPKRFAYKKSFALHLGKYQIITLPLIFQKSWRVRKLYVFLASKSLILRSGTSQVSLQKLWNRFLFRTGIFRLIFVQFSLLSDFAFEDCETRPLSDHQAILARALTELC